MRRLPVRDAGGLGRRRHSGTFVKVGHIVDMDSINFNINQLLMYKNLVLGGHLGSQTSHCVQALPILERGDIPFGDVVGHAIPLDQAAEGFTALNGTYHLGDETIYKITVSSSACSSGTRNEIWSITCEPGV